ARVEGAVAAFEAAPLGAPAAEGDARRGGLLASGDGAVGELVGAVLAGGRGGGEDGPAPGLVGAVPHEGVGALPEVVVVHLLLAGAARVGAARRAEDDVGVELGRGHGDLDPLAGLGVERVAVGV